MFARLCTSAWPGESCFKTRKHTGAPSILSMRLRSSGYALAGIQTSAAPSEHITWLAPSVEGKELFIGRRLWCNGVWQSAGGSQDRPRSGAFKSPFQSTVPLVLR